MDTSSQKVSCVVNNQYDAVDSDELTIRPGDVIREVDKLPGGWWRGELRGRVGMFPDNFVSVIYDANKSGVVSGRCRAVFSYQPANPDELPLCVGDILEVLGEVEEGWWQGRRHGQTGVFPSNFVVMIDAPEPQPAPALPPKPVKEQCRVLFPYTAVNGDELTLKEGDIVTIVSKDAPDRGWWKGELHGQIGLFPDNFVQLLPVSVTPDAEEKKPDRPTKVPNIYPVLNKYSEKTTTLKEISTSKTSLHKENIVSKECSKQSTVTRTNKEDTEKVVHNEAGGDGTFDGQIKKPPVPMKKSPTPPSGVTGLISGLRNKMLSSTDKEKSSSTPISSASSSSGEWDKLDGASSSKPAGNTNTFDHVERTAMLNDPRANRVKAPRRRPPSQVFREDSSTQLGLVTNGHEVSADTPQPEPEKEKTEESKEIKPKAREWEKRKAPWMEELKLNQAKKTSGGADEKIRSVSTSSDGGGVTSKAGGGSTDRLLDCGVEEKRSSSHAMEMSKSTSSISSRISVRESFEESKVRQSAETKRDSTEKPSTVKPEVEAPRTSVHSPTAAGRTLTTMLDDIKKPTSPIPHAAVRETDLDKARRERNATAMERTLKTDTTEHAATINEHNKIHEKTSTIERIEKMKREPDIERFMNSKSEKCEGSDALIAQLHSRVSNLETLLEVQNAKFTAAIEELHTKLKLETERRQALQSQVDKLAHCVTQV